MSRTSIHEYGRSVSIIGVGCTPFMYTVDHPETDGLTETDLFSYAARMAMQDAGVNPQNIDFYFHGQAAAFLTSNYITPNVQVNNFFGMKGKGSIHHSEGCCTGYLALDQAVNAVASGKYNCVLTGCVEMVDSLADLSHPYRRNKWQMEDFIKTTKIMYERGYTRGMIAGAELVYDSGAEWYMRTRKITPEQMNDTINGMCINNRKNASQHPLAIEHKTYEELAEEAGMTLKEYMNSSYNPKIGDFLRLGGVELKCDGAAACIVCATDLVDQYMGNKNHKAIEVTAIGNSCVEAMNPNFEVAATEEAVRQVYEKTGLTGEDLDLFYVNDFIITSQLISAEIAGYLPYGEGWKYICDGRTTYDGDRPINTNGGRTAFGHAHGASGMADIYEACLQMRGECGERQVKKLPVTTMLRGYGGAQNVAAVLLQTLEK